MTEKKYPPLDLSFIQDFTFCAGMGDYAAKKACIMSALYLAAQIAEGNVTLEQALDPNYQGIELHDRLECVSGRLRQDLVMHNDCFEEGMSGDAQRKAWAVSIMPRVPGTNLGEQFEVKLAAQRQALIEAKLWKRADEKLAKNPDFNSVDYVGSYDEDNYGEDFEMRELVIYGMLQFIEAEKARRAHRNEKQRLARAAKKAREIHPHD